MKLVKNRTQKSTIPRTLVIGDIHGSAKALTQVLDRAYVNEDDTIIQLGDVADGWSETSECVDILLKLQKTNKCIFIRGNHDVWVYDWMMFGQSPIIWTQQGGKATMESYIRTGMLVDKHHKSFWLNQEDYHIDDNNNLYIHGGWAYMDCAEYLHSGCTHRELFHRQAMLPVNAGSIAKECHWDRDVLRGAWSGSVGKDGRFKALEQFNEIFIGHTATRSHLPEKSLNLYNLDSGCGWSGKLTIMDIDTKEYWQSDFVRDLYPEEKGR